jgi:hypothetical protein
MRVLAAPASFGLVLQHYQFPLDVSPYRSRRKKCLIAVNFIARFDLDLEH